MWPVTERFLEAIAGDHDVATAVEVLDSGEVVKTLTTTVSGRVDVARSVIRRQCAVTFVDLGETDEDGTLTPDEASDLLVPYGNELRLWRGVNYPDGTNELVPLGTFVMTSVEGDYPTLTVTGKDRMFRVQEARLELPLQIVAGRAYHEVLEELLTERLPNWVDLEVTPTEENSTRLIYEIGQDMAEALHEMANSYGHQLFFDPLGTGRTLAEPEVEDVASAVARYVEEEGGSLLNVKPVLNTEDTKNVVVATGESNDVGFVRGVAADENPQSPTYAGTASSPSKFGRRTYFHSSPLYTTESMAEKGARTMLHRMLGLGRLLTFEGLPNPAHEASDLVVVDRPVAGVVSELHTLDAFPIHMEAGQVGTVTTRALQEVLPE